MPTKKQLLQDEAASLVQTITTLRAIETEDATEAAQVTERLEVASKRSDEVAEELRREAAFDSKVETLRSVISSDSEPRGVIESVEAKKAPAVHVFPGQAKGFRGVHTALQQSAEQGAELQQFVAQHESRDHGQTQETWLFWC